MESTVNFANHQVVETEDANNLGVYARASLDHVVKDLGGFPAPRYVGMLVEQTGQSTIRVGTGRFHKGDGSVYLFEPENGQTIDLLDHLPAVAQRIATVVAYGDVTDTRLRPRTKLTDAETRTLQGFEHATESRRQAYVSIVLGQENATPQAPAIQSDYTAVANVLLTAAGIQSITQLVDNRVKSVRENSESISEINARLTAVGPQLDTLKTDISGLGALLSTKADQRFVNGLAIDVARVKDKVNLPDDYATYGADFFLDESESDTAHGSYAARVNDGLRFPSAGSATAAIELGNATEPQLKVDGNLALPAHTEVVRASVVGNDSEYPLTNTQVQNVSFKKTATQRLVRKFCGAERVYLNSWLWLSGKYDPIARIFKRGAETWVIDIEPYYKWSGWGFIGWPFGYVSVKRYVEYWITEYHVSKVVTPENIAGSIMAQTVLNSQDGWMTGVDIYCTKKASSGSVRVLICDTDQSGNPMLDRVLAETTLAVGDLNIYPNRTEANFAPTFIKKGQRYAIVLASSNAHFVAQVHNNKFAQGTIKYLVDGAWSAGSPTVDLAFRARFAKFNAADAVVDLEPLELAGGIDSIEISTDAVVPDGTRIEFEVRVNGVWRSLKDGAADTNILTTRPAVVQFRARFIGTTDVMPALGIGAGRSLVTLVRPAATGLFHVSSPRIMAAPVDDIEVRLRVENWDNDEHSVTITLLEGSTYATEETADAVTSVVAPDDPSARIITAVFNLADVDQFKIKIVGNIGSSGEHFHVAERTDIEFITP